MGRTHILIFLEKTHNSTLTLEAAVAELQQAAGRGRRGPAVVTGGHDGGRRRRVRGDGRTDAR